MKNDLAQQLAAHPRFRWVPGMIVRARPGGWGGWRRMVVLSPDGGVDGLPLGVVLEGPNERDVFQCGDGTDRPEIDLADAGNDGHLLAMLHDETSEPISHERVADGWLLRECGWEERGWVGATLGEAAARALLALWGPA